MEIRVRIAKLEEQDDLRREDMRRMTPTERLEALAELRDRLYPYSPLERIISIRSLD